MLTLIDLYKHARKRNDLSTLEVTLAVMRERLPMPHAAVWWIIESARLENTETTLDVRVKTAKATGVQLHTLHYDEQPTRGYLLGYYVLMNPGRWDAEWDYDEIVVDAEYAEEMTRRYLER